MTTVLISGANRGIGLEFARQYVAEGATVIAGVRHPGAATALNALAALSDGRVRVLGLDVTEAASVKSFKASVGEAAVDILIANAGWIGPEGQSLGSLDYDGWLRAFAINTLGPVRLAEAFLPNVQAGRQKKLVAITSQMGSIAESSGGYFAYRSSKAALNAAWKNVALATGRDRIAAIVMHPGWVQTDMGGPGATLTPEQSVAGMRRVIAGLTPEHTGRFYNHDGAELPW